MNKQTSKYFNTAAKMNEALLSLLEKKDLQYITVKDICSEAEVNRSTFYLHYETIADLLNETTERIMQRFKDKFSHVQTLCTDEIATLPVEKLILVTPEYLVPYLEFVKENKRLFKVVISQPSAIGVSSMFLGFYSGLFYPIMKRFGLEDYEIDYKLAFYLQGMFAVISKWVQSDCTESVAVITDLLNRCVFPRGELPL